MTMATNTYECSNEHCLYVFEVWYKSISEAMAAPSPNCEECGSKTNKIIGVPIAKPHYSFIKNGQK